MVEFVISVSSLVFGYIGAAIIIYGGAIAVFKTVTQEIRRIPDIDYHNIRRNFTHKIVYGLDFLIAGDILETIVAPTQEELLILGATVIIRTILGYFLGLEVRGIE